MVRSDATAAPPAPLPRPPRPAGPGRDRRDALAEARAGLLDILPVMVAAVPIGLLFGAVAASKGLSSLEVALMSALVFAGGAQFVAVDLWTHPAPWAALGFAALLVNLRHVLMGASLAGKTRHFPAAAKPFLFFFMADENWALAERRAAAGRLTIAYWLPMALVFHLNWVVWTTLGTVIGNRVGRPEALGFDLAFTALFIALVAGFWQGWGRTGPIVAASALAAVAVKALVPGAWYVLAGALAGVAAGALVAPTPGADKGRKAGR